MISANAIDPPESNDYIVSYNLQKYELVFGPDGDIIDEVNCFQKTGSCNYDKYGDALIYLCKVHNLNPDKFESGYSGKKRQYKALRKENDEIFEWIITMDLYMRVIK